MSIRRIAIVGNGIGGITAARHIRKRSDHEITVISAESDHFFSRTALMYIYMGHMSYEDTKPYEDFFWEKSRIRLKRAFVERVDVENKLLRVAGGQDVPYDDLIVASGSQSNRFGWPGQDLRGVQGLYSLQDLELMETDTAGIDRAVIVGGGLIGIETAEMLLSRNIPVTFLVRERSWMDFAFAPEESAMINRHIVEHGVDLRLGTELDCVLGDDRGRVRAVRTKDGEEIACGWVALTVGVRPNVEFLSGSGIEIDRGVLVDEHLRTNIPDVYAVGDCVQLRDPAPGRRPIEAVWYVGRAMGEAVARTLTGEPTPYRQDIWFNSAKFFDIEWQIYGDVPAELPEGHATVFWQDEAARKSVRIVYRVGDEAVKGFQLLGVRYRHAVCDAWIREGRSIRHVLEHLGAANFDPELYPEHEAELVAAYNENHRDRPVKLKTRRGLTAWVRRAVGAAR